MNRVILMGRLTRDPEVRYAQNDPSLAIASYTLAVDRRGKRSDDENNADFISCRAFGKTAEFAQKYFTKGMRILIAGHIQTGSYTNREGQKVYTTDVIIDEQEFTESRNSAQSSGSQSYAQTSNRGSASGRSSSPIGDDFISIPDDVDDEGLPWN